MSKQVPAPVYPSQFTAEGNPPVYGAPPPPGYPTKDELPNSQQVPIETKSRGEDDGFLKGCCAALCCCCVLETCCG